MLSGTIEDVNVAPLVEQRAARSQDFRLCGRAARLTGSETDGAREILLSGTLAVSGLRDSLPAAETFALNPVFAERAGPGYRQRLFASARVPLVVLQWIVDQESSLEFEWSGSTHFFTSAEVTAEGTRLTTPLAPHRPFLLAFAEQEPATSVSNLVRARAGQWQQLRDTSPLIVLDGEERAQWLYDAQCGDLAAATAALLRDWGIEPDPERERIRIAPRIDRAHQSVSLSRLGPADGALDLRWQWTGEILEIEVSPVVGSVTPRVIFEPCIEGRVESVVIDGQPAALDLRGEAGGTRCPVQLVLDHPRRLTIRTA